VSPPRSCPKRAQFRSRRLAAREFRVSLESCKRRSQLVCRVGDEALLRFDRRVQPGEQPVERAYERAYLLRLVLLRHRAKVARRTCRDLVAKAIQGPESWPMPSQKRATATNAISNWGTVEATSSSSTSLSRFTSVSATWTIAVPGSTLTARAATRTRSPQASHRRKHAPPEPRARAAPTAAAFRQSARHRAQHLVIDTILGIDAQRFDRDRRQVELEAAAGMRRWLAIASTGSRSALS